MYSLLFHKQVSKFEQHVISLAKQNKEPNIYKELNNHMFSD